MINATFYRFFRGCRYPAGSLGSVAGLLLAVAAHAQTAAPSTWAFSPERDRFQTGALLDLRHLNEAVAGQSGFVQVNQQGRFVRPDGQPIRFWAVNSDVDRQPQVARGPLWPQGGSDLAHHARFLAKRGVNMVRQHRQISPDLQTHPDALLTDINEAERDAIWRMVAAMRKEGIYTTLSPYWAVPMKFAQSWGIAGGNEQAALGLLFFDETLRSAYKVWLKKLLTEKNPYTGLSLAQDPSLAVFQLQNEDSLLFWTVDAIQGPQRAALERRFAQFVQSKHGSLEAAQAAWGRSGMEGDQPAAGRLALVNIWELTQPPAQNGRGRRIADQTEFYARTMHDFNREMVDYLRKELGMKSLINAGNWKTASAERLGDVERWSYLPGEVDAVNHYFGGVHQGPDNGWAIMQGDRFTSDSALLQPHLLPVNLKQTQGRPMMVTESAWVLPNAHGAEGPFLIAAYTSLTSVAAYHWFATVHEGWAPPHSANGYQPSQHKWTFVTPEVLGSFPAAALAYRRGDIRTGQPVLVEQRPLPALWQRQTPRLFEGASFDPNRDTGAGARTGPASRAAVSPDAFLVGPVQVRLGADLAAATYAADLGAWTDGDRIRANTGELTLDHRLGVATVDTPRTQGVAAHFHRAPVHQLSTLGVRSDNPFGALMATSLDDKPLDESRSVLLQYATQSRPTGWREKPVTLALEGGGTAPGWEIESYGGAPWQVVQPRIQVSLRNPYLRRATALDMNGMPLAAVPVQRQGGTLRLRFPPATMYVVLR
ncbi:hypothetical protein [Hydrogenophaga sp.]|uniref:hypothetical protein n=1 Tax=Hydrogenophaga sp. TaxID=1904254 RepID=UPI002716F2AF|nr:hypothetical protein [Hydrogenophaga sp.]MDO8906357.1 hypothetical protein [Hydrogenophaga sp.]